MGKKVSNAIKFLVEAGIARESVDADHRKGIVWVGDARFAALNDAGLMIANQESFAAFATPLSVVDFQAAANASMYATRSPF